MAELKKSSFTPAQAIIHERTEAALQEPIDWPWPDNVAFIAADMDDALRSMRDYAREGRTLVVVFPDGEEVVLTPSKPDAGQ